MITFWMIAAAMLIAALTCVIAPLLRRAATDDDERRPTREGVVLAAAIYRAELAELEREFNAGHLSAQHRSEVRRELEARFADEIGAGGRPAGSIDDVATGAASRLSRAGTAALLLALLPTAVLVLYMQLGSPLSLAVEGGGDAGQMAVHAASQGSLAVLVGRLATRLQRQPDDAQGWAILARSYAALDRPDDAIAAYQRALMVSPRDAQLLADYADAQASADDGDLNGVALQSIEAALALDPENQKALALAGSAAFDRRDYPLAIHLWEHLEFVAGTDSEIAGIARKNIDRARVLAASGSADASGHPAGDTN
ncbi:cytochrome c-type biogenesis protein CcmI [Paraburkholderia xenovorans LB400]|uniref:Cytochrome c-type biogenesis protein n=1 Tax=Paraburkholderia xenovorans (strain LB400) TaxID=266265 RepID=Q13I05_PARXL|nr:c-type cytochrome biogenesis protein CcmI [Paraburkholderia xenovorans]ABE36284.1 Putative cytochrome c-type biogenesis protein [Paraburkholderia xenovorans LB400]AIP34585.1 cytochrome c-type biogenesis protein CcmI [Paraburkholderia xenovorans LB400]